ncbi:AtpZ/AtpI family protein [Candidatus Magnetominusculus xianensis]|uniref:Magnesium transporter n=1 Tax=Candidatus Magnetominusculus xianensis TaxID=1748249 RepID=A0ABR5SJ22_9BACT|nr:AtpZ/AtpI family protein [Candidatus Magnetominusculus xianensis]KWT91813.1 magnesium transporter [Candidatus Magnetominusculus xianensis]MBF0403869.1 AtpZ/AtpI family protein [Nitrospirota bacterium]
MAEKGTGGFKHLLFASQVGVNLVVATFVGFFIGKGLDILFNTRPYLTVTFLIFGIISGFIELFRTAARELKKDD